VVPVHLAIQEVLQADQMGQEGALPGDVEAHCFLLTSPEETEEDHQGEEDHQAEEGHQEEEDHQAEGDQGVEEEVS